MGPGVESLVGQVVAGYRLERVVGMGGTGAVFLGRMTFGETLRIAAVKVLVPPWQASPVDRELFRRRFLREVQVLQRLRHPHILRVLGSGEEGNIIYTIMPFAPGGSLSQTLQQRGGSLPLEAVANMLESLADALDYAHSQGIIHRDLKPANVLIDGAGQLLLADFGITRLLNNDATSSLTATGQILGTPNYMAPEQARSAEVTPAADIYSLGIMAYELVTGQVPFQAATPVEVMLMQVSAPPPPPHLARPDLPAAAEAVLMRALAKDPAQRWPSARDFATAFVAGLRGEMPAGWALAATGVASGPAPTMTPVPGNPLLAPTYAGESRPTPTQWQGHTPPDLGPVPPPPTAPRRRSSRRAVLLGMVMVLLVITISGVVVWRGRSTGQSTAVGQAPSPTATFTPLPTVTLAPTFTPRPTATPLPTPIPTLGPLDPYAPYRAAIPPPCNSDYYPGGDGSMTCQADGEKLTKPANIGGEGFSLFPNGAAVGPTPALAANFVTSIDVVGMAANACFDLDTFSNTAFDSKTAPTSGNTVEFCGDGSWELLRSGTNQNLANYATLAKGVIAYKANFTIEFVSSGANKSIVIDGNALATISDYVLQPESIGCDLSGLHGASGSVLSLVIKNFAYLPSH